MCPDISIVVPIYNETSNVRTLYEEAVSVLDRAEISFEFIMVDDGSVDDSFQVMEDLARSDPRLQLVRLNRNFGQTAAMAAGFHHARGQVVVTMDGDLQNDPRDIPALLEKLQQGYDIVSGWRKERRDCYWRRKLPSYLANALISRMTGIRLRDYGCTLKAYRREILSEINLYGELHRFVPALASQVGARVTEVPVNHRPRSSGVSKYGLDRTLRVILDLMTVKFLLKYSVCPLQLFGKWGIGAMLLGAVAGGATLYMKFFEGLSMNRNPLLVLTAFLLFSGVHFIAMGLLGELVTRTYHETQGKPVYVVRETRNLPNSPNRRKTDRI